MNRASIMSMIIYWALLASGSSVGSPRVRARVAPAMRNISEIVASFRCHADNTKIPIVAKKNSNVRVSIIPYNIAEEYEPSAHLAGALARRVFRI